MTKKEVIRKIRNVMAGYDGHTMAIVRKLNRGYDVYTTISNYSSDNLGKEEMIFRHQCNEMTLKEAKEHLEQLEQNIESESY